MAGKVLTVEAYLRTEEAYVETVMAFHEDAGAPILCACGVEAAGSDPGLPGDVAKAPPLEGQAVRRGELAALIRACLREIFWCRLEAEDGGCAIHFGYDFYVYLTGRDLTGRVRDVAHAGGLFLEPFQSPYATPA
ncbi:hypothetical protein [Chondromyces apiculatus]|uniref:Uncharacterized protein n=1 Tax=Chondromyces apiculatus DSM 436 TaxID=1192034 RepID=A0A017T273_9BACT|nr:hypothetical protein [Chondromyces apiculatus]EYF02641.1 Hypothetical protein CAP_6671 [Chondromyces apiculatus DSM 436]